MLDIRYIRENPEKVQESARLKGYDVDVAKLLEVDEEKKALQQQVDEIRQRRNDVASRIKDGKPEQGLIDEGKRIKIELSEREEYLKNAEERYVQLLKQVPNIILDDVPLGGEEDSLEVKVWGEKKEQAIDHLDFAVSRDWVDFERGARVAGTKFYFLKNELALLEQALLQYGIQKVVQHNFKYMTVPHMVRTRVAEGAGFAPKGDASGNEYFVDGEDLTLIGTAEAPLTGYHADEILDEEDLPLLYAGYSPCYRKESGSYGQHIRGLFRVHQFNKLEMYAFCLPEDSARLHEMILGVEEEIWQELGIPYHVINIAAGDLGAPAVKKYDIEYWSPVDMKYREITSCSNCTDYQARGLNIRVRRRSGEIDTVHTLNGTAISFARALVAIIENNQNDDGTLTVPEVLQPYFGGRKLI